MKLYKTEGIVIKKNSLNDNDEIITILTPFFGKIKAVAKSIKTIRTPKRGKLELTNYVNLLLFEGRNLDTISEVETISLHKNIFGDLKKISMAFSFCEVFDKTIEIKDGEITHFNLLKRALNILNEKCEESILHTALQLKLIDISGYFPNFYECVYCCNKNLKEDFYFDFIRKCIICENCLNSIKSKKGIYLNKVVLSIVNSVKKMNLETVFRMKLNNKDIAIIENFTREYLRSVFNVKILSWDFMDNLISNN